MIWSEEKNARRCVLIDKKIDGQLTQAEEEELENLQQQMLDYRQQNAPLPLKEARALFNAMKQESE